MKELTGDLWEVEADARVITTNGAVRKDGQAVTGRGVALQAKERWPIVASRLGAHLRVHGNVPSILSVHEGPLISLPVKHHWRERADLSLIRLSLQLLVKLVDDFGLQRVVLPRPGCGNGGLSWPDVKPLLEAQLDDRFTVVELP